MESEIIIALLYGIISIASAFMFKILPMGDINESFRKAIIINFFAQGAVSLLAALAALIFRLSGSVVLYLVLGDIIVIGGIALVPAFIRQIKEGKSSKNG